MPQKPGKKSVTPAIINVSGYEGDYFEVSLSNGHSVMYRLADRIHEPAFEALIKVKAFEKPKTDGKRLYWTDDGPSLPFDEIMKNVCGERKIARVEAYEGNWEEIDIDLDNKNMVTIDLKAKKTETLFAEIIKERLLPHWDGGCVYWINGASLTLQEITDMLRTGCDENKSI